MKKKIKDFTEKEIKEICDKFLHCMDCPFCGNIYDVFGCYAISRELWGDLEIEYEARSREIKPLLNKPTKGWKKHG